ncbi:hypothetical protein QJU93_07265 [Pasteurella skyensis]|uniref:Uncharacterized protein n=1 Tax=Phocoenobacter skyensis TaxID=97481 RepID=A0AAJ6NAG5_9PAST|nr:hypothetical protein [Pasteurella skyensis]MDP8173155.1 hypothetical protein [Pasteurella skyensis]MDP8178912.1 hypothetical protein [Pasteurella skyensis]
MNNEDKQQITEISLIEAIEELYCWKGSKIVIALFLIAFGFLLNHPIKLLASFVSIGLWFTILKIVEVIKKYLNARKR